VSWRLGLSRGDVAGVCECWMRGDNGVMAPRSPLFCSSMVLRQVRMEAASESDIYRKGNDGWELSPHSSAL